MDDFVTMYLCFTGFLIVSGLIMIVTYSLSYPWWRDWLGRLVIIYASAEIAMSAMLCSAVVFRVNPTWFRAAWFALQLVIGLVFCAQTAAIVRLRRGRRQREQQRLTPPSGA